MKNMITDKENTIEAKIVFDVAELHSSLSHMIHFSLFSQMFLSGVHPNSAIFPSSSAKEKKKNLTFPHYISIKRKKEKNK